MYWPLIVFLTMVMRFASSTWRRSAYGTVSERLLTLGTPHGKGAVTFHRCTLVCPLVLLLAHAVEGVTLHCSQSLPPTDHQQVGAQW